MSGSITIRQPKPLPGEVPWDPPFQYHCSEGHEVHASKAVKACPAAKCEGTLKRFGPGSGTPRSGK